MITKTIPLTDLGYDDDVVAGITGDHLENGEAEPVIVEVNKDGSYSLSDGYHRLAGMLTADETEITIGIIEDSDWSDYRASGIFDDEDEFTQAYEYDNYESLVDWLSGKIY